LSADSDTMVTIQDIIGGTNTVLNVSNGTSTTTGSAFTVSGYKDATSQASGLVNFSLSTLTNTASLVQQNL
jgi:hypothetical protein